MTHEISVLLSPDSGIARDVVVHGRRGHGTGWATLKIKLGRIGGARMNQNRAFVYIHMMISNLTTQSPQYRDITQIGVRNQITLVETRSKNEI